jgi:uncharacterized protein
MNIEPQTASSSQLSRRGILQLSGAAVAATGLMALPATTAAARGSAGWDKVFPKSSRVHHHKVSFRNRYGITLSGDLYLMQELQSLGRKAGCIAVTLARSLVPLRQIGKWPYSGRSSSAKAFRKNRAF